MQDLNDLYFYAQVVERGGFAAAGRDLKIPKSKLSRRIAQLEARLGVRLIERSTRRFRVTEVGQAFYERCRSVVSEAEQAEVVVMAAQSEPHGLVRFSCPTGLIEPLARILPDFLERYPRVTLQVVAINRPVDLIAEKIDLALRVRTSLDTDASLTVRVLARSRRILVASPAMAKRLRRLKEVSELATAPTLSSAEEAGPETRSLVGPEGASASFRHQPRFLCSDFAAVREAAIAGLGVALLPDHACSLSLSSGQLVQLFPEWSAPEGLVHLVFLARRGLPPAVRALIDHLVERFGESLGPH